MIHLRSEPLVVSFEEARKVFGLTENRRPLEYIENTFEDRDEIVRDHVTGLVWQKSGSDKPLTYKAAQAYVERLNRMRFAGYASWRLPTVEELMSLLEPEKQPNGLYITPIFDETQRWCWSADTWPSRSAWHVSFYFGNVYWNYLNSLSCFRGVCSGNRA